LSRLFPAALLGGLLMFLPLAAPAARPEAPVQAQELAGRPIVRGLGQVNHVLVDDEFIYWTEMSRTRAKVRRMPLEGGRIVDLATERTRDSRGLQISFIHLQQTADHIYWTRRSIGFFDHWSILSVPKEGGQVRAVLKEDISIEPMLASAWRASGRFIIASLQDPDELDLPENTRIAAYDTHTGTWAPLLQSRFKQQSAYLLAANGDNDVIYVRGINQSGDTETGRLTPSQGLGSYELIATEGGEDGDVAVPGATDGTNLYFWTRQDGGHVLVSRPVTGGATTRLQSSTFGPGLTTDGTHVYWTQRGRTLLRAPVSGGRPETVRSDIFGTSVLGGVTMDGSNLYLVRRAGGSYQILRVAKN